MSFVRTLRCAALATMIAVPAMGMAAGATFMNGKSVYGQLGDAAQASRVIDLATASHSSVVYGETIRFVSDSKEFTWTFNGLDRRAIPVADIAPADFNARLKSVHVGRDPSNRH